MSEYISKELRERITIQAHHRCGYCLTAESIVGMAMEIDHNRPRLIKARRLWSRVGLHPPTD